MSTDFVNPHSPAKRGPERADGSLREHGDLPLSLSYFAAQGFPTGASILDIGCRFGSLIEAIKASDYRRAFGLEIDGSLLARGGQAYPQLRGKQSLYDGEALPFADGVFDVVTLFDVLEHVPEPDAFLGEVTRVLSPGGRLVFQTPNRYINIPWEIVQHRSFTHWRTFHCSLQSLGSLRRLLEASGFDKIRIEKYGGASDFKIAHARRVLGPLGALLVRLAHRLPLPLCPNLWGHARKPAAGDRVSAGAGSARERR